ncbi:hypothetical protein [Nocardia sp. CS682]|uniref:hypothetical protein n=1 Tax=Nocardia sp. CS682 TaxID=1047172 RepID=UPI001074BBEB|nr:hypothetical protein [Nocardia sp. CS682]QBS40389.1 hypothetical protein DMB37_09940 [Nocardia sp. CS682]
MPLVTEYYGITGPVPFEDVKVETDNRIYIDPHAVRLSRAPQPFADQATHCLDTFFEIVAGCVMSTSAAEHRRGLDLLQHFGEPRETRLGMSAVGTNGHGGAELVGRWIWDALCDPSMELLLRVGILREIEAIPMFVTGIDRDITSDFTTRIIFSPLVQFTAEMMTKYPEFKTHPSGVTTVMRQIWDPTDCVWVEKSVELPLADGKPLLLVPKGWVRRNLLMSAGRYYQVAVLGWAQEDQTVVVDGNTMRPTKEELKRQAGLARGRATNVGITRQAHERTQDLIAQFIAFVDRKWTPPSHEAAA